MVNKFLKKIIYIYMLPYIQYILLNTVYTSKAPESSSKLPQGVFQADSSGRSHFEKAFCVAAALNHRSEDLSMTVEQWNAPNRRHKVI